MRRDRRFLAALLGVGAVVGYLVWTGASGTWVFFVTPSELLTRVEREPEAMAHSWRVSGMLVPGSYERSTKEMVHRFVVQDPEHPEIQFRVEYRKALPDTFTDDPTMEVELVLEGTYQGDGLFAAEVVNAKCGSRYEAMPEVAVAGGGVIE